MNKSELVFSVQKSLEAKDIKVSKTAVEATVNSVLENIRDEVKTNGKVTLIGFGTYKRETREARMGRNPSTGESIQIAEKQVVKFKPASTFLD